MFDIYTLKNEAKLEIYNYYHLHIHKLPKTESGDFNETSGEFVDNEIDALRHAYVSGVYTIEYGERTAEILGRLNEFFAIKSSNSDNNSSNMDLWNNFIGRKYGKKSKNRKELLEYLISAFKNNELILHPSDLRKYKGKKKYKRIQNSLVLVTNESPSGENLEFVDYFSRKFMNKTEFIIEIENGNYSSYSIRKIKGKKYPISKKDKRKSNNLG